MVDRVIIGDKDRLIYSFWKTLFKHPQCLIGFVKKVELNLDNFYFYKGIAANETDYNEKELAKACLFLNRTSFSGILANNAGPIGGRKQQSEYSVDCRFNRGSLVRKIEEISRFRSKVTVFPYDWKKTVDYSLEKYKEMKVLLYLDPPFFHKADKLYRQYFVGEDSHRALRAHLKNLEHEWILSYDRAPEIRKMYRLFTRGTQPFPYSINSPARRIVKEYFITSKGLKKPPREFLII